MRYYSRRAPQGLDRRDDWRDSALCAQTDPTVFFPDKGESAGEAKHTCLACPVRAQCLTYALTNNETFGVWGGLTARERAALRRGGTSAQTAIAEAEAQAHAEEDARKQARDKAVELLHEGLPDLQVAAATGLGRTTVGRLRGSIGLPNRYAARTPQDVYAERAKPGDDGHMEWVGAPAVSINNRRYTAAQLAFRVGHDREPEGAVMVTCGRLGCVDPAHLADQAMRVQARQAVNA